MRLFAFIALLTLSFTASAADIEWEGWSLDYSTIDNSSGLVLRNVDFEGTRILARASMPVMRVEYDNDFCGPYADILWRGALRSANSGAPNDACNGLSICQRTYEQNGVKMLELGSNWQIGEYQIYQTYYFSELGYFDARVYSRGLQCVVNHRHHAHWMLDFDIDGAQDDRVLRNDNDPQLSEFNDLKSDTAFWTIEDKVTNRRVRLTPAVDDGSPDAFAQWDVAVRTFKLLEVGRWLKGARGEIGNLFIDDAESIDGEDLVFWYVSHLTHNANEGDTIWHSSGPRIQVTGIDNNPQPQPEPQPQPQPQPQPEPEPEGDNILANAGFESGLGGWFNCGDETNISVIDNNPHSGSNALSINNGGCIYQEQAANAGEEYILSCQTSRTGSNWTIMELAFLDAGYNKLGFDYRQIQSDSNYNLQQVSSLSPDDTRYVMALIYSEDNTLVDTCILQTSADPTNPDPVDPDPVDPDPVNPIDPDPVNPSNLLLSGGFEDGLNGWRSCGDINRATLSNDADSGSQALAINGGGCMYQEFPIETGQTYNMSCRVKKNGATYTSVTLALQNGDYQPIATEELPVNSSTFNSYQTSLTAPNTSRIGVIVAYSEARGVFDSCTVSAAL